MNILPFQNEAETASGIAGNILTDVVTGGTGVPVGMSTGLPGASELGKVAAFLGGGGTPLSLTSFFGPNAGARIVTGILGMLLIAAAIFTHPTVVNVSKKVAKAAGEAAAAA
jgi:hypothetical protein